jgi:KipI family sensor histidine kinase inhibitor
LVSFGEEISQESNASVVRLLSLLEREPVEGVRNLHPAYCSLLVKFDGLRWSHEELEQILREYEERAKATPLPEARQVEIPVCYGDDFGPDLDEVARLHGISTGKVIELHTSLAYTVFFLGFVPGFAYMGELPAALRTPRLAAPRKRVPAGSVGIAGRQTGVYPVVTPGGWRLLGRTPLKMFDAHRTPMSLLRTGDRVHFVAVSRERYAELERA